MPLRNFSPALSRPAPAPACALLTFRTTKPDPIQIKKKKTQKPHERSAQREAALREVKERNKAKKAAAKKNEGGGKSKAFQKTKGFGKGASGGKQR